MDSGFSCSPGSTNGPDVFEDALTELVVVVVDLPGPLRRIDHQRVLAGNTVQQLVDGRVGDAQWGVVGALPTGRRIELIHGSDGGQRRVGLGNTHVVNLLARKSDVKTAENLV